MNLLTDFCWRSVCLE